MQIPLQVAFRGVEAGDSIHAGLQKKVDDLERRYGRITSCRVVVEAPHLHHQTGNLYHVRVDLTVPGKEIVVKRDPPEHRAHEDLMVALRDAFKSVRRRLQDYVREVQGQVKLHEEAPHAKVARIFRDDGYGFLRAADGHEVYFHENSVEEHAFGRLLEGDDVAFLEEPGKEGPQAAYVRALASRVGE